MIESSDKSPKPLAIVGLSFRLPQDAVSPKEFWEMIIARRCTTMEFPPDRLNIDAHYHPEGDRLDSLSIRGGNFLKDDLGHFDAPFFSITATEAEAMEPPQRLLLETAFHALENAGIPLTQIAKSKTAVFAGSSGNDWVALQVKDSLNQHKYSITGQTSNMLANRVSWFFDLKGPSVTVDTACSSSLLAVDLTCQSIWSGQSTMGLAMGSNLLLAIEPTLMMNNLGLLSKDSRCYSFDERSNGYSRGEGVGVLVIKLLEDAIRDGDTIRSVIRAASSNQDGKTPGITQPSSEMQATLIRDTYHQTGLDMGMTRYFEAHGTGTAVGDPIEARAIGSVFRLHRSPAEPLYVGSIKSNIGHLEGASGIAAIMKVILALEKGVIPPNSENLHDLNPRIDDEFWNLNFPQEALPWPTNGLRRASISSFGYGGSNTHIVLDDAFNFLRLHQLNGNHNTIPTVSSARNGQTTQNITVHPETNIRKDVADIDAPKLLVWSAADEAGIPRIQNVWGSFLSTKPIHNTTSFIQDLAHTLSTRRTHLPWKSFVIARPSDDLASLVKRFSPACHSLESPNIAMIFSGQGAQWYAMGRDLLYLYPTFMQGVEEAGKYLYTLGCKWNPVDELQKPDAETNVNRTEYSQILCTILQIALVDLLQSFNIVPAAVLGHSSGEVAAAYCSGAISRRSAWKVSYYRGNMSSQLEKSAEMKGSMLAVALSEDEIMPYINSASAEFEVARLTVGCINSPQSVAVSGEGIQLDALKILLDKDKIFCRRLKVNLAYHSSQMAEIAADYLTALGELEGSGAAYHTRPQMVSSITGDWIHPDAPCQVSHWVRNMISPVRFSDGLATLCSASSDPTKSLDGSHRRRPKINHILEIGPHSVLQGACKDILKGRKSIKYLALLVRNMSAVETAFSVFGDLYAAGYPINLTLLNKHYNSCKTLPDLPEYPFNHDQSYWHESKISKNYRLRKVARNGFLGLPDPNQNPLEGRWRNIIRISEMPWVQDHKINGTILYPGAGMIVMAIEAAKQTADKVRPISGFNVENVTFPAAIRISSSSQGVETSFHLRPAHSLESKRSSWFNFRLCTLDGETWVENCTGSIQVLYGDKEEEIDKALELEVQESRQHTYTAALASCKSSMRGEMMYEILQNNGYGYGPAFQLVTELSQDKAAEFLTAVVRNFSTSSDETIHPTTLDAIFQTSIWTTVPSGTKKISTAVPTHIDRLWVDSQAVTSQSFKIYGSSMDTSQFLGPTIGIVALDDTLQKTLVSVQGLRMNIVDSPDLAGNTQNSLDSLCHEIVWKPDLKLLSDVEIMELCKTSNFANNAEHDSFSSVLDFFITVRIKETLSNTSKKGVQAPQPHLKRYYNWLIDRQKLLEEHWIGLSTNGCDNLIADSDYFREVEKRVLGTKQGHLFDFITQNIVKVLSGELDPSALFKDEDMLNAAYNDLVDQSNGLRGLGKYLDLLSHSHPRMKILEVGGGFGTVTKVLINALRGDESDWRFECLDYTDVSPENVAEAKTKLSPATERVRFKILNIEKDPETQDFDCGTYDMVVASLVPHQPSTLQTSLQNIRKLLKPGGKLVLHDGVALDGRSSLIFGVFEQWWQGKSDSSLLLSVKAKLECADLESRCKSRRDRDKSQLDELLRLTGYSGLDIKLPDISIEVLNECSVMICSAVEEKQEIFFPRIEIVYDPAHTDQLALANSIVKQCELLACSPTYIVSVNEALEGQKNDETMQVFILELQRSVWSDVQKELFETIKAVLSSTLHGLWITQGGGIFPAKPHFRLADGLLRVLMEEDGRRKLHLLSIDPTEGLTAAPQQIAKLVRHITSQADNNADTEYLEQGGIIHIPRLVTPSWLNETVSRKSSKQQEKIQSFKCQVPLQLDATSPGLISGFKFIEKPDGDRPLNSNEVEVEIKCAGVNFRDVLIAVGQLKASHTGSECAGIVIRVGDAVSRFQVGDSVAALGDGCFATSIRMQENGPIIKIPVGMSFEEAAVLPVNYATAYIALHNIARIQPGETVLIHSGTGGTGQAAIQIAKNAGATIFATVGSQNKKQFLIDTYQIPESHIFSSRTTFFTQAIKHRTGNKGVDILLNSLAGESLLASWECMAPYGRFLEIGKRDILSNQGLPMLQFLRNVTYSGVDLAAMTVERPEVCAAALKKIFASVQEGKLHPSQPIHQYGVGEIEKAFRLLQGGQHVGKMVLQMRSEDEVTTVLKTKTNYFLDPDSTFVVCGGLGGIGRNIVTWLADRGARHLLLLSRSGAQGENSRCLIDHLKGRGVQVMAPKCDVSDRVLLQNSLIACMSHMPPIKGCIQAAMVLRDALFENISYQSWHESISPKVQGSWNLHKLLPLGMDFFIMLSSIAGLIGTTGQANYAAGNTFQDALAYHRVGLGEKATSLDLGVVEFAGAVAEDAQLREKLIANMGLEAVTELQLHAMLDHYCDPQVSLHNSLDCQVTVGLSPSATQASWLKKPMFWQLKSHDIASGSIGTSDSFNTSLQQAESLESATALVTGAIALKLSNTLSISTTDIDANKPLHQYGVDSLVAVELRSWFYRELQAEMAVFDILGGSTLASVAQLATSKSRLCKESWPKVI
ncbi:hypothetical protein N7495_001998 [Penicillium taxi]|uniref:uncharacterized protein n=1 Tax=Penicillium taxi TaxID=168475 RepID=UPI0025457DEB|nr:uncharacterized protein N7495_001998 [Penicillium taxi]KAJ5901470.1 hypothetical protein N7495_001998 [Penicillium taxi]